MPETAEVSADALREACRSLEGLAKEEYGATIAELFAGDEPVHGNEYETKDVRESQDAVWRVGRLIGITIKEPFASPRPRTENDLSQTGARRVWELQHETLNAEHPDWWQYRLIAGFLATEKSAGYFDWLPPRHAPEADQVAWFLAAAHSERGVFGAFVKSARKYLCSSQDVRAALANAEPPPTEVEAAGQMGQTPKASDKGRVKADPAQAIFTGVTSSAAGALVATVPWLAPSMTPLIAGLLLVISAQGLDAFCSRVVPSPVTEVVET